MFFTSLKFSCFCSAPTIFKLERTEDAPLLLFLNWSEQKEISIMLRSYWSEQKGSKIMLRSNWSEQGGSKTMLQRPERIRRNPRPAPK